MLKEKTIQREIVDWGYVALVSLGLLFTSMTAARASANGASLLAVTDDGIANACLVSAPARNDNDRRACDPADRKVLAEEWQTILSAPFRSAESSSQGELRQSPSGIPLRSN